MKTIINKVSEPKEVQKCLDIRVTVFVQGQNVPMSEEADGKDTESEHYLLSVDGHPVGTARIRYLSDTAKIERVAILEAYQGKGLGKALMNKMLIDLQASQHVQKAKLGAQTYAIPFYEKLGFKICSEIYMEAGIPHKDMEKSIKRSCTTMTRDV